MDTNHSPIISPLTMRESARGITLTSIYDEMLARRELSVMGNIETPMAHDLCQQIRLLDGIHAPQPPHHHICRQRRRKRAIGPCDL